MGIGKFFPPPPDQVFTGKSGKNDDQININKTTLKDGAKRLAVNAGKGNDTTLIEDVDGVEITFTKSLMTIKDASSGSNAQKTLQLDKGDDTVVIRGGTKNSTITIPDGDGKNTTFVDKTTFNNIVNIRDQNNGRLGGTQNTFNIKATGIFSVEGNRNTVNLESLTSRSNSHKEPLKVFVGGEDTVLNVNLAGKISPSDNLELNLIGKNMQVNGNLIATGDSNDVINIGLGSFAPSQTPITIKTGGGNDTIHFYDDPNKPLTGNFVVEKGAEKVTFPPSFSKQEQPDGDYNVFQSSGATVKVHSSVPAEVQSEYGTPPAPPTFDVLAEFGG